jgi:ferrous iron transport protein A
MIEKPLADMAPGEEGEIIALEGGEKLKSRLRALGLAKGQRIRNMSRIGWGGPLVVLVNRAQIAIGRGTARKILVRVEGDE